jgi:hypothetical protein
VNTKKRGRGSLILLPALWFAFCGEILAAEVGPEIDPEDVEAGIVGEAIIGETVSEHGGGYRGGLSPSCRFIAGFGLADGPDWNRTWARVAVLDRMAGKPGEGGFFGKLEMLRENFGYTAADFSRMAEQCRKSVSETGKS